MVFCGSEKLMNIRLSSTNTIKQDSVFRQVDICSNEFVCSGTFHMPTMSHDIKALLVGRATNENHLALRSLRVIQLPVLRHLPTCRRYLKSFVIFFIDSLDIKSRLPLNRTQIFKMKSLPNTPFPSTDLFDKVIQSFAIDTNGFKAIFPFTHRHGTTPIIQLQHFKGLSSKCEES